MKVGILTFHFAPNYGAVYQALGMQEVLKELGHDVFFIDYVPPYMRRKMSPFRGWGLRSKNRVLTVFISRIKEIRRRQSFRVYTREHLEIGLPLRSRSDLIEACNEFDAIIVGSDQIWNLNWQQGFDATYFLGFLSSEHTAKKISYAACFGTSDQPHEYLDKARSVLCNFDSIFVRNDFTAKVLSGIGVKSDGWVCDPAFHYRRHAKDLLAGKRRVVSIYTVSKVFLEQCRGIARAICKETGSEMVEIRSEAHTAGVASAEVEILNGDPDLWFDMMDQSLFTCVSSFHGVVYAIAHNIPFAVVAAGWKSERILDLLTRYNLEDRLVDPDGPIDVGRLTKPLPDLLRKKVESDVSNSRAVLASALDGTNADSFRGIVE